MPKTYVDIVNDTIEEAGVSLQGYSPAGIDWNSIPDPMCRKFKKWVTRAWTDIQQEANDWEFLNTKAVVSIDPGIEFYTDAIINAYSPPTSITIYGNDGVAKYSNVQIKSFVDLSTKKAPVSGAKYFGYFNITVPDDEDLNYSLKSGNDYFFYGTQYRSVTVNPGLNNGGVWPPPLFSTMDIAIGARDPSDPLYEFYPAAAVNTGSSISPVPSDITIFTFTSERIREALADGETVFASVGVFGSPSYSWVLVQQADIPLLAVVTAQSGIAKCYIRGWRSYDFSEETAQDDYQIAIKEVQEKSFRLITKTYPEASLEKPLQYMSDAQSNNYYNLGSTTPTNSPSVIFEDNEGRWRLYPPPSRPMTLMFNYSRVPQIMSNFSDYPWYLQPEFVDLIMWKALIYYGEHDEQPSIILRATRRYKDMMQKLENMYRPKLKFVSAFNF